MFKVTDDLLVPILLPILLPTLLPILLPILLPTLLPILLAENGQEDSAILFATLLRGSKLMIRFGRDTKLIIIFGGQKVDK